MELNVWIRPSRSLGNGCCVEVNYDGRTVAVRDTKDRKGPELRFSAEPWTHFILAAKAREFDIT
jgi:hypothetical protein